jgi:hypothetical protein
MIAGQLKLGRAPMEISTRTIEANGISQHIAEAGSVRRRNIPVTGRFILLLFEAQATLVPSRVPCCVANS